MKKLAWVIGAVTLLASGSYVFIYLYRWEWHRALLAGILFIAAEVALGSAAVLRAVHRLGEKSAPRGDRAGSPVLNEPHRRSRAFEWLSEGDAAVFLPILLAGGVVVSAVAWVIEKLAANLGGADARRSADEDLAPFSFPAQPFVATESEAMTTHRDARDLLSGPTEEAS